MGRIYLNLINYLFLNLLQLQQGNQTTLRTYLLTYLPSYLPPYIPTYLHTYIPTYLSTYLPIYLPIFRILCPKVSIKLEDPSSSSLNSCNTAVSNSNSSNSGSSMLVSRQRILPALRHTISSPLISTQLKG